MFINVAVWEGGYKCIGEQRCRQRHNRGGGALAVGARRSNGDGDRNEVWGMHGVSRSKLTGDRDVLGSEERWFPSSIPCKRGGRDLMHGV